MANELIKMKTGLISDIEKDEITGQSPVAIQAGTIYFAIDNEKKSGKILYDVDSSHRVVMGTQAEYSDYAAEAAKTTGITGIYPVRGTQAASTNLWTGSITGVTELIDGLTIAYYLPFAGTSTAATLQLYFEDNGTYSASVPIYYTGTTALSNQYGAGSTIILTYWEAENMWSRTDYNTNDNTIGYRLRTNDTLMTVTDTARYYKLYFTSADNTQWVPASVNSTNNATSARAVNQRPINPFGRIVYMSASSNFAAGSNLTATSTWDQYHITLGYSFNPVGGALTLTPKLPVYIQCTLQNNGSAIIDATTPYVQTLPQVEMPNKIYIYLGVATAETTVELLKDHPVYWFKGGRIRQYTDINEANGTESGLMSASDKAKFDDGLVIAGNTIAVGGTLTASDLRTSLGLSNAMHFIGIATVTITEDSTTNPNITDYDFGTNGINAQKGDVVIDKDLAYEYVWTGTKWEKLGPDSYGLSINGHTVSIVPGGSTTSITIPNDNIWNKVSTTQDGYIGKLSGNANQYLNGNGQWSIPPNDNDNTTYGLSIDNHTVSLVEGGATTSITLPNDNIWLPNTKAQAGYVSAPGTNNNNKVWKTNASGEPGWRDDDNTTYSTGAGLVTASGNVFKVALVSETPSTLESVSASTTSNRQYPVVLDKNNKLSVNVPWSYTNTWNPMVGATTENNGSVGYINAIPPKDGYNTKYWRADGTWAVPPDTQYSAATSSTLGLVKLFSDTQQSVAANSVSTTNNRTYGIQTNSSGQLVVNVPWVNENTWDKVSTSKDGYITKLPGNTTTFFRGDGTWETPPDTKVTNTLSTTTKYYVTGTTSASTNTGTQTFDTGIYATTTAGELNAKQYKVDEAVTLQYNTTTKSLDFIFA